MFKGAFYRGQALRGEMQILDSGFDVGVTQQALEYKDVGALLQLVGGKAMAQGVDAAAPGQAGFFLASSYIFWAEEMDKARTSDWPGKSHGPTGR